jgi:hypothetical protein
MKKLTLVSFLCRNKVVMDFVNLPVINGKTIISQQTIDDLFYKKHGFIPQRGETISIF